MTMPNDPSDSAWSIPSTAPVLGVCEWSPEGLHDKSVISEEKMNK